MQPLDAEASGGCLLFLEEEWGDKAHDQRCTGWVGILQQKNEVFVDIWQDIYQKCVIINDGNL